MSLLLALFLPSRFHLACACYAFGLPTWLQDLLLWKGDVGLGLADELQLEGMFHESNAVRAFLIMPPIDFETISGEDLFDILMYSPPPPNEHIPARQIPCSIAKPAEAAPTPLAYERLKLRTTQKKLRKLPEGHAKVSSLDLPALDSEDRTSMQLACEQRKGPGAQNDRKASACPDMDKAASSETSDSW